MRMLRMHWARDRSPSCSLSYEERVYVHFMRRTAHRCQAAGPVTNWKKEVHHQSLQLSLAIFLMNVLR